MNLPKKPAISKDTEAVAQNIVNPLLNLLKGKDGDDSMKNVDVICDRRNDERMKEEEEKAYSAASEACEEVDKFLDKFNQD